jgi:hypothetical protein
MFILTAHKLELWNASSDIHMLPYASPYEFDGTGADIACRDNLLYLARNSASGGMIDVLSGS